MILTFFNYIMAKMSIFTCSLLHVINIFLKALHQERKRRNKRILTRLAWAPLFVVILPLFIDIWYVDDVGYFEKMINARR